MFTKLQTNNVRERVDEVLERVDKICAAIDPSNHQRSRFSQQADISEPRGEAGGAHEQQQSMRLYNGTPKDAFDAHPSWLGANALDFDPSWLGSTAIAKAMANGAHIDLCSSLKAVSGPDDTHKLEYDYDFVCSV